VYYLRVSFHLREDTRWAKAGHEVAWQQLRMPYDAGAPPRVDLASLPAPDCEEQGNRIVIRGSEFECVFDRRTGTIVELRYSGRPVIAERTDGINGPVLNVFRAPVNNDRYCDRAWREAGLDRLRREVKSVALRTDNPRGVVIETLVESHGQGACRFDLKTTWTVFGNGCIDVDNHITPHDAPDVLPRLGLRMIVAPAFDTLTWLGRGPHENYIDRKRSADIGLYRGSVAGQFVPYVDPQETGNKEDVRWAALLDGEDTGLLVVADATMSMSALHHTAEDLGAARHPTDLPRRAEVVLCLDAAQNGLGGASCGPPPMNKYLLRPRVTRFGFSLRPYHAGLGPLPVVARVALPRLGG
jgi:beta-galactosidase